MSFNSVGTYTGNYKTLDRSGHMTAPAEYQECFRSSDQRPAAWLPVKLFERATEDWITVTPGKIVAFDNAGRLCPAQYGLSGATITYTSNDVAAGVIDVRTGAALLANATGTFNVSAVSSFMGTGVAMAVSHPIGVASYNYFKWAGDGGEFDDGVNPAGFVQHNYNRQHSVAVTFDYGLELPVVPAITTTANLTRNTFSGSVQVLTALGNLPVAKNTIRTPLTFANGTLTDAATRFVSQKATAAEVVSAGDWHIDYDTGVISVYAASQLAAGNIYTLTYSHYASAPTGSNVSVYACALGDLKPGDFLKCNADSNWVKATPKVYGDGVTDNFDTNTVIMGQIIKIERYPQGALEMVRTPNRSLNTSAQGAFPGSVGQLDQLPGTATGGVTDKMHYAGAADMVVIVNLISR